MPEGALQQRLTSLHNEANINRTREQAQGEAAWSIYDRGIDHYEIAFSAILEQPHEIRDFVAARRQAGKTTLACDLMGNGRVLRDLQPDAGLAVTLTDLRTPPARAAYDAERISLLAENIYEPKAYRAIWRWLQRQATSDKRFHLILERASGGHSEFPNDPKSAEALVQNLWRLLSDDHGRLYLQIPMDLDTTTLQTWVDALSHLPGVRVRYADKKPLLGSNDPNWPKALPKTHPLVYPILCLEKLPGAPEQLPQIF